MKQENRQNKVPDLINFLKHIIIGEISYRIYLFRKMNVFIQITVKINENKEYTIKIS